MHREYRQVGQHTDEYAAPRRQTLFGNPNSKHLAIRARNLSLSTTGKACRATRSPACQARQWTAHAQHVRTLASVSLPKKWPDHSCIKQPSRCKPGGASHCKLKRFGASVEILLFEKVSEGHGVDGFQERIGMPIKEHAVGNRAGVHGGGGTNLAGADLASVPADQAGRCKCFGYAAH